MTSEPKKDQVQYCSASQDIILHENNCEAYIPGTSFVPCRDMYKPHYLYAFMIYYCSLVNIGSKHFIPFVTVHLLYMY